jgi:putative oxidoreductase
VVASVLFHNYWSMPADKAFVNQLMFFKNIAISGGLLAFVAFGAGRFSIDKR